VQLGALLNTYLELVEQASTPRCFAKQSSRVGGAN